MLIIKKFHDYYDSSMSSTGIDKTCVYERFPFFSSDKYEYVKEYGLFQGEKIGWHTGPYYQQYGYRRGGLISPGTITEINPFVIGFCGKTYVGYAFTYESENGQKSKVTYGIDEFLEIMPLADKKVYSGKIFFYQDDLKRLKSYHDLYHEKPHQELFVKYKVPIFVIDFGTGLCTLDLHDKPESDNRFGSRLKWKHFIMYNPMLKDYDFFRIFNSAHAFQEIQMYMQGVLGSKEKEIVEVGEKYKIAQHGMDKWSFRNPDPPKRKQK